MFVVLERIAPGHTKKRQVHSVRLTNLAILGIVSAAWLTIGLPAYLAIQLPIMVVAGVVGIWLCYVQHQFEPSYWARSDDWQSLDAALHGSSYYKLPAILRWFSANIGLHHIHHLRPRIPNYNLPAVLKAFPQLELSDPLTIGRSIRSVNLNLWDEARGRLVSFRQVAGTAASA